ncbi:ral guanine nucleotide dissociation stimulator-like 2 isoform X1 [Ursus americanus]|uniref:ral guanine nucleotide dissociation stimulator-like 2 isoform X1 n=1 Tax=Ursus americanus TaxID=9643 RepID=UPI001E67B994|nr:ral guanine nucleotide dissociation stimulator-like 2 isoform X1 [Ursus americanus]XP_045644420.1 ral guanine nucleotide dissociation stimulator-like 2 isoform X1 [Ursus americanus]
MTNLPLDKLSEQKEKKQRDKGATVGRSCSLSWRSHPDVAEPVLSRSATTSGARGAEKARNIVRQDTTGLSSPEELLVLTCHPLGSAECLHSPPREHVGEGFQKPLRIFQKLCSKDTAQGRNLLIKDTGCRALPWHFPHQVADVGYRSGGLSGGHGSRCRRLVKQQSFLKAKLHEVCLSGPQPPPGNEINHHKRNKEYQVMTDIMLLQVAAENYTLEPEDPFWAWFQAMEPLSEAESYTLSCQLEPRS